MQNLRVLVCDSCYDKPQQSGQRTILIPADPVPIMNPRPEFYVADNNPLSGIGYTPNQRAYVAPTINPQTSFSAYNNTDISALNQFEVTSSLAGSEWTITASAANDSHVVYHGYFDGQVPPDADGDVPYELNNRSLTLTIRAKPGTVNFASLNFQFGTDLDVSNVHYATAIFNLTTGAVTQSTKSSGISMNTSATAAGGGYFTLSLTATYPGADLSILFFQFGPSPTGTPALNNIGEASYLSPGASIVVTASPNVSPWTVTRGIAQVGGYYGAFIGTMNNLSAAFDATSNKPYSQSAAITTINSSYGNYIGVNWSEAPATITPSSLNSPVLTHSLTGWSVTAPNDTTFGSSAYVIQGSNVNGGWGTWTTISSGVTAGTIGETISGDGGGGPYQFHRVAFAENDGSPISVASVSFSVGETSSNVGTV